MDLQSQLNLLSQQLIEYEKEMKVKQRKRKKLRKVAIDSEGLLSFIEHLAVSISECLFQEVPDRTDIIEEGLPKLSSTSALLGIATGLVLANYQEGIAADAVKKMNAEDLDSADNLLDSVLSCYQHPTEGREWVPEEHTQWLEVSNWYLPKP